MTPNDSMPSWVALSILQDFVAQPSAHFGWHINHDDPDFETKLGTPYLPFREWSISLADFASDCVDCGSPLTQDEYNSIRRWVDSRDEKVSVRGIMLIEVFGLWRDVSQYDRDLITLGMFGLNTMDDLHNWIIPFMENVAETQFNDGKVSGVGGMPDVYDFEDDAGKAIGEVVAEDEKRCLYFLRADTNSCCGESPPQGDGDDIIDDFPGFPALAEMVERTPSYDRDEVVNLMAWIVDDICQGWRDGLLTIDRERSPSDVCEWLSQQTFDF